MKISNEGLNLIKNFESFSPVVYKCPAGLPTIGYGHVLNETDSKEWKVTEDEALVLLDNDCNIAETAINAIDADLEQNQFDALVSLVFNIGIGAFKVSTCKKLLQAGKTNQIPDQFDRWVFVKGVKSRGLINRRNAEKKLFIGGDIS